MRKDLDADRRLYYEISDLCDKIESKGNAQNVKAALDIMGVKVGPPRPPLLPRGEEEREEIRALMAPLLKVPV